MKRTTISLDFLGISTEIAQACPDITIGQFIQEILVEFGLDYSFLNQHQPQDYVLRTAVDGFDLPFDQSVHQIGGRGTLFFREKDLIVPETAVVNPMPFYLRYRSHIFKIGWLPALIGRPITGDADNALLAVNLEPFSLAVSRRQAKIVMENGRFAIRNLSENPILLNGKPLPFVSDTANLPASNLQDGDTLLLQRSGITLTCLQPAILPEVRSAVSASGGVQ